MIRKDQTSSDYTWRILLQKPALAAPPPPLPAESLQEGAQKALQSALHKAKGEGFVIK